MFKSDDQSWLAIHRTYTLDKKNRRETLYSGTTPAQRMVTNGCPNVEPHVYEALRDNHRRQPLVILP
jgi:hypothetical protein